jgi:hypothetical protein
MRKIIQFYRKIQYGIEREYIHPCCEGDAAIIRALTGKATIDGRIRELIRDLTAGAVSFQEVIAP